MMASLTAFDLGGCNCPGGGCPPGQDFCQSCGCTDRLTRTLTFTGFGGGTVLTLAWISPCVWSITIPASGFVYTFDQRTSAAVLGMPVLNVPPAAFGTGQLNAGNSTVTVVCSPFSVDFFYGPGNHLTVTP